jgi:hypothetical protein
MWPTGTEVCSTSWNSDRELLVVSDETFLVNMNYNAGSSSSVYGVFDEAITSEFFDFDFDGSYSDIDVTTDSTTSADDDSNSDKSEGRLSQANVGSKLTNITSLLAESGKSESKMVSKSVVKSARRIVGKKLYSASQSLEDKLIGNKFIRARGQRFKKGSLPLFVFPSYDKCDSLVFFPHAMSRSLNSSDFSALEKLFTTHLDRNCDIKFACYQHKPTARNFARLFEFMNDMHPDTFMCVHNTLVVENRIQASIYLKFTDCRAIIHSLERTVTDPFLKGILAMCSDDRIRDTVFAEQGDAAAADQLLAAMKNNMDSEVYLTVQMSLTFDDTTKKVKAFAMDSTVSSIRPLSQSYTIANCL